MIMAEWLPANGMTVQLVRASTDREYNGNGVNRRFVQFADYLLRLCGAPTFAF